MRLDDDDLIAVICVGFLLLVVCGLCIGAYVSRNRLETGVIVEKVHKNPTTKIGFAPIIGGNGGGAITTDAVPEKWIVVVRGYADGEERIERHEIDRYEWESVKVGEKWSKGGSK